MDSYLTGTRNETMNDVPLGRITKETKDIKRPLAIYLPLHCADTGISGFPSPVYLLVLVFFFEIGTDT